MPVENARVENTPEETSVGLNVSTLEPVDNNPSKQVSENIVQTLDEEFQFITDDYKERLNEKITNLKIDLSVKVPILSEINSVKNFPKFNDENNLQTRKSAQKILTLCPTSGNLTGE
jgi:hypothetical protein